MWRLTQRVSHIPSISPQALLNWMALRGHVSVSLLSLFFSCPANKLAQLAMTVIVLCEKVQLRIEKKVYFSLINNLGFLKICMGY